MSLQAGLAEFISGAAFGMACTISRIYSPSVISSQMRAENLYLLSTTLIASAASALVVDIAHHRGHVSRKPRPAASLGLLPYDANIAGGLLIGGGMALSGSDPGCILTQIGVGVHHAIAVGVGMLLGGILWTKFGSYLKPTVTPTQGQAQPADIPTLQSTFGLSDGRTLTIYAALSLAFPFVMPRMVPSVRVISISPFVGGFAIGTAQAVSVLLARRTIGVSTAYFDLGRRFWKAVGRPGSFPTAQLITPAVTFACGVVSSSLLISRGNVIHIPNERLPASGTSAILSGTIMAFGAGLAGGCPAGHGFSGTAAFSLSSFFTVMAIFVGGTLTHKI